MPSDAAAVPTPGRAPGYVPGSKRARHKRWTRVATVATVATLVAFGVVVALLLAGGSGSEDSRVVGCRAYMDEIAVQIEAFAKKNGRLPDALEDLAGPESPSPFDPEPWDCWHKPFEYRVVDAEAREFRLRSYGADKMPDTADDLVWPEGAGWR